MLRNVAMFSLAAMAVACGDNRGEAPDAMGPADAAVDAGIDAGPDANPQTPARLFDTGLCVDLACTQIAADAFSYTPRWALWTDGADKDRWIRLPPGTKIDNSDPDHWQFPVGTKVWKSFSLGGIRVETRYMVKLGPGSNQWFMVSYAWNTAQTDTLAVPSGRDNANGTTHDIPSRSDCRQCHDRIGDRILGFSALALDYSGPANHLDLDDLVRVRWLGTALPGAASPHYPLPTGRNAGEIANAAEAVGYLHINCGHCHNPQSPVYSGTPLQLRLTADGLADWPSTTVYSTTVNVAGSPVLGATIVVKPQAPDESILIKRMTSADESYHMPALGSVVVDPTAQTRLLAWINSLPTM
jgi:hypothetical protein